MFPVSKLSLASALRSPVVSVIPSGQKSMRCCQQFCFLFFSSHVWCSTGFSVGTCAVCFVHYSTQSTISFSQMTPNFIYQLHQTTCKALHTTCNRTYDIKAWMCNNQLKLNEEKTEAILFSTPSLSSCHCLPSSIMVGTHEILTP